MLRPLRDLSAFAALSLVAVWISARADDPTAPSKVPPTAARQAGPARASFASAAASQSAADAAAKKLQTSLDNAAPGAAVRVVNEGATLGRPVLMDRPGVTLYSYGHAVLRTTGAFPPVIVGSPPRAKWKDFPGKHRVAFPAPVLGKPGDGGDGTIPTGLDLSDAVLHLRGSALERIAGFDRTFSISAILARKGDSWGGNGWAPLIQTDPDRAAADPLRLAVTADRVLLWFRTNDGVTRHVRWVRPADTRVARLVVMVDCNTARIGGYIDGKSVTPDLSQVGAGWGPGLWLAAGEFPSLEVGRDVNAGQGNYILGGLRIGTGLAAPIDVPDGTALDTRGDFPLTDLGVYGPSPWNQDAALDLAATATQAADDPLVAYRYAAGAKVGFGMLAPTVWSPFDTVGECAVKDLGLYCGDGMYGSCLSIGVTRNLTVSGVVTSGGARGIDQQPQVVSYPLWISDVKFLGHSECALDLGRGIVFAEGLSIDRGPSVAQIRVHSAGGEIDRFFIAEQTVSLACVAVKMLSGPLALRRGFINYEESSPPAYILARRDQAGVGMKVSLLVDRMELGSQPAKVAAIDLQSPYWGANTAGGIGAGTLTVRDSFTQFRPGEMARVGGGWTVGPVPPGTMADGVREAPRAGAEPAAGGP